MTNTDSSFNARVEETLFRINAVSTSLVIAKANLDELEAMIPMATEFVKQRQLEGEHSATAGHLLMMAEVMLKTLKYMHSLQIAIINLTIRG